jgi:hypothetical protein
MPIIVDRKEKKIDISVATTGRIASTTSGIIGHLIITSYSDKAAMAVERAEIVDGYYQRDIIVDSPENGRDPNLEDKPDLENTNVRHTRLYQNWPNPANPTTTISFDLKETSRVQLSIYNVNGQLVRTLVNSIYQQGRYEVNWDGRDQKGLSVSCAVYFCKLDTDDEVITMKIMILK